MKSILNKVFCVSIIAFVPVFTFATTWTQTTDSDFSPGTFSNSEISNTGTAANVSLTVLTSTQIGCSFIVEGTAGTQFPLDSSTRFYSIRFTSHNNQTPLSKIHLCVYLAGSPAATYRVGIQTDNAATHKPSGAWYDSVTVDSSSIGSNGWMSVTLGGTKNLTSGTIYHLVVAYDSGTVPDSTNHMGIYGTVPQMGMTSFDETKDTYLTVLESTNGGTTWTDKISQPMYIIEGGVEEGSVYFKATSDLKVYSNNYLGEIITIRNTDKTLKRISFRVKANTASPEDHLYAVLEDVTNHNEIEAVKLVDKNSASTSFQWYSADFTTPRTLKLDTSYRIYLKSPSSTSSKYYSPYRVEGYNQVYWDADQLTFDGTNSVYTENIAGAGWDESFPRYDILCYFSDVTYATSGEYTSMILDAGAAASFSSISWTPTDQMLFTSLKIQIASSNSESGPWNFYGSDGTTTGYYANASGEIINAQHSGKRYLKYKAVFSTSVSGNTPALGSVSINYTARTMPGTDLQTLCYPVPYSPSNGNMSISYILASNSMVTIKIYSALGDLVRTFNYEAGVEGGKGEVSGYSNKVTWDGKNGSGMGISSGAYFLHVVAEPSDGTAKLIEKRKIMVLR
ncbi:MAG: hypothetical protein A2536_10710 [Candidatus Firestonebacteria bacterium RIFOXYD2_FULL_39_29]|nr:MAG: hypothetical protein A2536_10710 [Candidatus Firestonebacteria bacterium RIFOXYD2_FULL_39_29]